MAVNPPLHFDFGRTVPAFLLPLFVGIGTGAVLAQGQNPTSAANPFYGSVTVQQVTNEPLKLSLDDAIQRGLKNNLGLREAENGEKTLHGMRNEALQEFLPTIWLTGDTGYYMHNLASSPSEQALRSAMLAFWKTCTDRQPSEADVLKRLNEIAELPGFTELIDALVSRLTAPATASSTREDADRAKPAA